MSQEPITYDASRIQVFEGLEAVRKRPGMYIGSTTERGLHHLVFEVAERSMNEILAGRASRVAITLTADGGVRVADDGPGGSDLEARLTQLMVGRPAGDPLLLVTLPGVGLAVVNALSSRLVAEVRAEGSHRVLEYACGGAVAPPADTASSDDTATVITFWPDPDIFQTTEYSFDILAERFRELAFLNRDLDISLIDERDPAEPRSARFHAPGGLRDMIAFLDEQTTTVVHPDILTLEYDDPRIAGTVEVALRWRGSDPAQVRSFANSRPTTGGAHVIGFNEGVTIAANTDARKLGLLAATDPDIGTDLISEGLLAVVSVKLECPEFEGSTRSTLANGEVRASVREAVVEHLSAWLLKG